MAAKDQLVSEFLKVLTPLLSDDIYEMLESYIIHGLSGCEQRPALKEEGLMCNNKLLLQLYMLYQTKPGVHWTSVAEVFSHLFPALDESKVRYKIEKTFHRCKDKFVRGEDYLVLFTEEVTFETFQTETKFFPASLQKKCILDYSIEDLSLLVRDLPLTNGIVVGVSRLCKKNGVPYRQRRKVLECFKSDWCHTSDVMFNIRVKRIMNQFVALQKNNNTARGKEKLDLFLARDVPKVWNKGWFTARNGGRIGADSVPVSDSNYSAATVVNLQDNSLILVSSHQPKNGDTPDPSHKGPPSNRGHHGKRGTTGRTRNASATGPSSLDSLSRLTGPKLKKIKRRQLENQFFENRDQNAMTHSVPLSLPPGTQMQVKQPLQVDAPPPAPAQPEPVEEPWPREKQIFVVEDHQRCVMSNMATLWKSGKLCDAGLGNGSSTIKVHKLVLYAVCPKLLSVSNVGTISQGFLQVNFPETVSMEALNAFAEYMYDGILNLNWDILAQLKIIAKRLDMEEFEQLCDSHLPSHMHQPTSFTNLPSIQPTTPNPASLSFAVSTPMQSDPAISAPVIKQEIPDAELAHVKKEPDAVFSQESEVASPAPNTPGNTAGFVISPYIKMERPEDDEYGHWGYGARNQTFTSTASPSSSNTATATYSTSIASVPVSPTEFTIPFSGATDVKSTRLKASHSYEAPFISDFCPASGIVETVHSQSNSKNEDSSEPLSQPSDSLPSVDLPNGNDSVYPVRLFSARGDNLHLTTDSSDPMTVNSFIKTEKP